MEQIAAKPFSQWSARVYEQGIWWRYEVRMPSGGGWHSRGYRTRGGAHRALNAEISRLRSRRAAQPTQR